MVTDEVDRIARMVENLFLLTRAEHPDFVRPEQVDLEDFPADLHHKLTALAPVELQVDVPAGTTMVADAHLLTQAVTQLVANALRHAGDAPPIELAARASSGVLVLSVADDGPGVPAGEVDSIFERNRRGSSAGTDGAGFGLAIVRAIAEALHGQVRVVANQGGGARFEVVFPLTGFIAPT